MKRNNRIILISLILIMINAIFISAQEQPKTAGFRGQSINGATGLFSVPSGRIGWDDSAFGLDFGYRAVINNNSGAAHIPAVTASILRWVELSAIFDIQPDIGKQVNDDLIIGIKIKMPTKKTALALGGNVQFLNIGSESRAYYAYQPYISITYSGIFFNTNADTTLFFGKTLYSGGPKINSNIDFGMGFDVVLFPDVFANVVHWIIDFTNFGYSDNSWPNNSYYHTPAVMRGILNTGIRIDLSAIKALSKFKLILDFIFNDLFDSGSRSFIAGAAFGFKI